MLERSGLRDQGSGIKARDLGIVFQFRFRDGGLGFGVEVQHNNPKP